LHVLSFDFEEWFHIFGRNPLLQRHRWDNLPVMLPRITGSILEMLERHRATATFFCLGWVASRYPQLIRAIASAGHEVAAHSYWHEQVHRQQLSAFRDDLFRNIGELESITGTKVISYRAPAFTLFPVSGHAVELLLEAGIRVDSSIMSGMRYNGMKLPNRPFTLGPAGSALVYYPVSTFPFLFHRIPYAGSGYFRLLPFHFVKRKLAQPGYHMLYFHPRDLDDRLHEVNEFNPVERLRFLPGTGVSMAKLGQLLATYNMSSIISSLVSENNLLMLPLSCTVNNVTNKKNR
jgi:polysaccharide deacetylase family protein (PEP-CTERM system associated)